MVEDAPESSKAWSWNGLFASFLLAATICSLGIVWRHQEKAFERIDLVAPERFDVIPPENVDSDTLLTIVRHEMAWRPLSQAALNRFLVAARLSGDETRVRQVAAIMESFAWRTIAGQLNLIALHLEDRDYAQILDHADALLRLGSAQEEVYALLSIYELVPARRRRLVERLEMSPPWRRAYLASAERLLTVGQIEARYATLHQLLVQGPVGRDELSSLLSRMVEVGAARQAYDLWRMAEQPPVGNHLIYDGDFRRATAAQDAGVIVRYPFEWEFDSGRGSGALPSRQGDVHHLALYWNGQGSPIFAKQTIKADPGRYRLTLEGVTGSRPSRSAIGVELVCPNSAAVIFGPVASADDSRLEFETNERTSCGFPQLRLVGRADEARGEIELTLLAIKLVALR